MKFNWLTLLLIIIIPSVQSQVQHERAFRIRKEQFPAESLEPVKTYLEDVKKLRFYKEIDSNRYRYRISFKKERLFYNFDFAQQGAISNIGVLIQPVDIPNDSWKAITNHLQQTFVKYKVRSISQQYPRQAFNSDAETFRTAFQNLILPQLRYGLVVRGKRDGGKRDYEALYNNRGEVVRMRKSLPPNYDHVLY